MLANRLLLVTLLTTIIAIYGENSTDTTFTVSPNNTETSSGALPEVVFEVVDEKGKIAEEDVPTNSTDDENQMREVDLTTFDEELDGSVPNDTKIETNAAGGDAPQIVFSAGDEKNSMENMKVIPIEPQISEEEEDFEETTSDVFVTDGVVLPTDNEDFFESTNGTNNGKDFDFEPVTLWDRASLIVQSFAHENPKTSILVLAVLFSIVLLLIFLVLRECYKRKRREYRQNRLTSITADLYNTSSCSHRYSKVTLPDNKEVTMELMSADNTSVMV